MTPDNPMTLTVRSPAELLGAVPYLLGFHPADSAVVLALRGSAVAFTARVDLPPAGSPDGTVDELTGHLAAVVERQEPGAALLVGYGPQPRVEPVLTALRAALTVRDVPVREALRADGGRYWSYVCSEPACCPPEGTPYDPSATSVAAAATYAGCVALPDRAALERTLDPATGPAATARARAMGPAEVAVAELAARGGDALVSAGRDAVRDAVARYRRGGRLTDEELNRLTLLLTSLPVRDHGWQCLVRDAPALDPHLALWADVVRRCAAELAAA